MKKFDAKDIALWCKGEWDATPIMPFNGVSKDSRTLQKGDIYFALKGDRFDGHDFVQQAFDKGAAGVVVQKEWVAGCKTSLPVLRVEDTLSALQAAASGYR